MTPESLTLESGTGNKTPAVLVSIDAEYSNQKVAWRETAARNFEAKNAGVKVKITWYEKEALFASLKTALRAGQAPDLFYMEPDQTEYIENAFLLPLNDLVNWGNIYDWARAVCTYGGKTYGLPQEVYTIECTTTRT